MRRTVAICLIASLCGGCAAIGSGKGRLPERQAGSRQLAAAAKELSAGNSDAAAGILNVIVSAPPLPGVTDEALFRLALLSLKPGPDKPSAAQGQQLLKRLAHEYPKSQWTLLAEPVRELLGQNKSLKGTNQSLQKEIGELNRSIEKLKRLDLELEQKTR